MKYFSMVVLFVMLAGCGETNTTTGVVIDIQEWTCSKTELTEVNGIRMVGRVPVRDVESKHVCVQWSRMGK